MYSRLKKDDDLLVVKERGTESFIFDPYNSLNKEITVEEIESILRTYNVKEPIHNFQLYKRAFIHRSYVKRPELLQPNLQTSVKLLPKPDNCLELVTKSNERLEFLGDGVLECIAKFYLYKRFPKADEGFMTDAKIELVKNESIGRIAMELKLHDWFIMSKHAELKNVRGNYKRLGCLFESFIGALFLDFNRLKIEDEHHWFDTIFQGGPGFQMAQLFVESIFDKHVDWSKITKQSDNYKRPLQELIQNAFKTTPHLKEMRSFHIDTGYTMGVFLCLGQPIHKVSVENALPMGHFKSFEDIHIHMAQKQKLFLFLGEGVHRIKQTAEQIACKEGIEQVKQFRDFEEVIQRVQQKHNVYQE
jgi:dsRNA-specific ribonuclease